MNTDEKILSKILADRMWQYKKIFSLIKLPLSQRYKSGATYVKSICVTNLTNGIKYKIHMIISIVHKGSY